MRQGSIVLLAGLSEGAIATLMPGGGAFVLGWIALISAVVGVAMMTAHPTLLGKSADGRLPAWSYVLFAPWHALIRSILVVRRRWMSEPLQTEIHPGWRLGGWPWTRTLWTDWPAIIDMTCELPRRGPEDAYLCLPTWDATAPTVEDLDRAVAFAHDQRQQGRELLIHCAAGHGRSACALAACLVAEGLHPTWQEALAHMQRLRPAVHLLPEQERAMERWARSADAP